MFHLAGFQLYNWRQRGDEAKAIASLHHHLFAASNCKVDLKHVYDDEILPGIVVGCLTDKVARAE
jgi:hypothetical protein